MTISEALRHQMYERFVETSGTEVGDALMEHLPPTGWADVATKADVAALRVATKQDIHVLGTELRNEMSGLGADLRGEISDLRGEMAELRGDMRAGFAELRGEIAKVSGELHRSVASQTRVVIAAMFGMMATSIGGVVSVAALAH
ncbi:MAG TPA: hypothetical protein VHC43_10260 [Mycobacteriales bacterium]|nr:hypothetical protein [Mycobacteriales bacterium]